jgi:hypothetical protein
MSDAVRLTWEFFLSGLRFGEAMRDFVWPENRIPRMLNPMI